MIVDHIYPMRTSPFFTENMFSDLGLYHDMDTVDKLNFYTENKEWKVMKKKTCIWEKANRGLIATIKGEKLKSFSIPKPRIANKTWSEAFFSVLQVLIYKLSGLQVESSTATRSENKYETVAETYPDVTFTFHISRRSPSYRWSFHYHLPELLWFSSLYK